MLPKNTCGENGRNLKTPIVIENESPGKKDSSRLICWNCIGFFSNQTANSGRRKGIFQTKTQKSKGLTSVVYLKMP